MEAENYVLGEAEAETSRTYKGGFNCPLLAQLKKMERPTPDDVTLINDYKKGSLKAANLLVIKHYKYILKNIIDITEGHWFAEDILQAGILGLLEAAKRFDPTRGYTFLTYATSWINKFIYIEVRNELLPMGGLVIGRDAKERLFNFIKLSLQGKTDQEIMDTLKINSKKLNELKIMNITASRIKSLDYENENAEGDVEPIGELIEDKNSNTERQLEQQELNIFVEKAINAIAENFPIAAQILNMRLGTNGEQETPKKKIREKLGLSISEYSKQERKGNMLLRGELISAGWYDRNGR